MNFARFALLAVVVFASAAWLDAQEKKKPDGERKSAGTPSAPAASVKKGKTVYEQWCEICHFAASNEQKIGPGLRGIYKRGKFTDGKKVDDSTMRGWIEKGGKDMPAFKDSLSAAQIADLIAYLRTL
jgi:mono/diheme cytochrome c family protein